METLFANNLTDPDNALIPRLASDFGTWSNNGLNYTIVVRSDVTFHDGTLFNAAAVKWNFNRLNYFITQFQLKGLKLSTIEQSITQGTWKIQEAQLLRLIKQLLILL